MGKTKICCLLLLLVVLTLCLEAQEYNSVPLDHAAYDIIEAGIMQGIISSPPSARPWSVNTVKEKLWEMINSPEQILSRKELDVVISVLDSFERKNGLDLQGGRYRRESYGYTFEAGLEWESSFSIEAPGASVASINMAKVYTGGDFGNFYSWNITALGEFLYIGHDDHYVSPVFPYTLSRQWDGRVLSLRNPGVYSAWPYDPSLAGGFLAELNGVFLDNRLQLRLGRLRRDWGPGSNGTSLFMNAQARPFAALEGTYSPLSWLDFSFMNGVLEYLKEDSRWPNHGPFINMISMAQVEINPLKYFYFSMGGSIIWLNKVNSAFFSNLELRLPGFVKLWGSLFVDQIGSFPDKFFSKNRNNYAYQAGVKTIVHWLPFAAFTISYTKVEPYCYTNGHNKYSGGLTVPSSSAYISGGESLGYYLPPNSDELLVRFESRLFPEIKAHIQYQMMRHGADYGYGWVPGSSLRDRLIDGSYPDKYFLMDGVYRWDNVIKLGGSCNINAGKIPVTVYAETGLVLTRFTINGSAGVGNEAEYESLNDSVYSARNGFIFSAGFRLFPR